MECGGVCEQFFAIGREELDAIARERVLERQLAWERERGDLRRSGSEECDAGRQGSRRSGGAVRKRERERVQRSRKGFFVCR